MREQTQPCERQQKTHVVPYRLPDFVHVDAGQQSRDVLVPDGDVGDAEDALKVVGELHDQVLVVDEQLGKPRSMTEET